MEEGGIRHSGVLLFGSITLGALGAVTWNRLREKFDKKKEVEEEGDPGTLQLRPTRKSLILGLGVDVVLPKIIYNRLMFTNEQVNQNSLLQELKNFEEITCEIERIPNLLYDAGMSEMPLVLNPMLGNSKYRSVFGGEGFLPEKAFVNQDCFILQRAQFGPNDLLSRTKRWLRAGPRKHLFFRPEECRVGIVTCGGLCPGTNVVIRELTMCLYFNYKVSQVYGAKWGFNGIYDDDWMQLTPKVVKTIHHNGGSFLGTARSMFDPKQIVDRLQKKGINQLYVLGGEGTLHCVLLLYHQIRKRGLNIVVGSIPKSTENDIPIIDRSFGFETAVEGCQNAIYSAYAESHSRKEAVGIVKVMGRHSGFLAMDSVNASRSVNICLVPEFPFDLYGKHGLLEYVSQRIRIKGSCVIVIAEGAVQCINDYEAEDRGQDKSGNVIFADVANILKQEIRTFTQSQGLDPEIKVIDPHFLVRTGKSNAHDSKMCTQLAQNAIHAMMAGFTGFAIGHVSNKTCMIPIEELVSGNYSNRIQPSNQSWQRLLASTGQPSFINDVQ